MALFACKVGTSEGSGAVTFKFVGKDYTSPIPASGTFTIGGGGGGVLFLNKQFKKATISNLYGGFVYELEDGRRINVENGSNINISDVVAIHNTSVPGTGYINYFDYSFT